MVDALVAPCCDIAYKWKFEAEEDESSNRMCIGASLIE